MQQLSKGATLQGGKYIIDRVLGQGGFGITYLATHSFLEKPVAIKEFFPKDFCERNGATSHITLGNANTIELVIKLKEKFLKEAKNISKLNHPNIVAIHDIFEENGTAYYLMDFIDGISLNDKIKSIGALPEEMALKYIRIVGNAISYMHSKKMNHLDIKPANIMLRKADDAPILIDFGLAKQYDSTGEQTSTTPVGISHGFAPIEQYRPGGVSTFTPQTDIYALGATLFNLLSGSVPPHYSEILEDGLPELPSSVSQKCTDAVEHAMEIKKNKRPASVADFISELYDNVLHGNQSQQVNMQSVQTQSISPLEIESPKEIAAKSTDDTMMIGDIAPRKDVSAIDNTFTIDGTEFVDLGLSVKWAKWNVGADSETSKGHSFTYSEFEEFITLTNSYTIPTMEEFQELQTKCVWTARKLSKFSKTIIGWDVTGPNGNQIYFPIVPVQSESQRISKAKWIMLAKYLALGIDPLDTFQRVAFVIDKDFADFSTYNSYNINIREVLR